MEIVKKHLMAIICGVIALVALIALFWPVGGMYSNFQEAVDKRAKVDGDFKTLVRQPRTEPPLGEGAPPALTAFPSKSMIDRGKAATELLHQQAVELLGVAVSLNREGHDLLVRGSLPRPASPNESFLFRGQYNNVIQPGGKPVPWDAAHPANGPLNLIDGILNATRPASPDEIQLAKDQLWRDQFQQKVIVITDSQGQTKEANRPDVDAEFAKATEHFAEEFRKKRATQFKMYIEPDALTIAQRMDPSVTPGPEDMWYAQMSLWLQKDVAFAIRDINMNSRGVPQSPLKHLVSLVVPQGIQMYVVADAALGAAPSVPGGAVAASTDIDPGTRSYTKSVTGRVCNSLFDVVQFRMVVVCDASRVEDFVHKLEYGRFITVLRMDLQNVDTKTAQEDGYDYGNVPCVQLTLDCESLWMRDWTARAPDAPMPPEVQKLLGIPPPTAPAAGPVASGG